MSRRAASLTTKVLLSATSTVVALCFAELWARQADPHRIAGLDMSAFTRPASGPGQVTELIPGASNPHFLAAPSPSTPTASAVPSSTPPGRGPAYWRWATL